MLNGQDSMEMSRERQRNSNAVCRGPEGIGPRNDGLPHFGQLLRLKESNVRDPDRVSGMAK